MMIIEVSTRGTHLHVKNGMLAAGTFHCPLDDIDQIVLQVPAISITGDVLVHAAEAGVSLLVCNSRHMPVAIVQPVASPATLAAAVLRRQAKLSARTINRVWRCIVRCKVVSQADLVAEMGGADAPLRRLAHKVEAGDPSNIEAQAARLYWPRILGRDFRRSSNSPANAQLDWGYAVLRALVHRAIVSAGLHPALGLHHRSGENSGNLADDLIEPLRPSIDRLVVGLQQRGIVDLTAEAKSVLAAVGDTAVLMDGEWRRLRTAALLMAQSLRHVVDQSKGRMTLPQQLGKRDDAGRMAHDVADGLL